MRFQKNVASMELVQANGALRDMLCRGLMLQYRAILIGLPGVRQTPRNPLVERSRPVLVPIEAVPLPSSLAEIRPPEFHQVRRTPEEALFNSFWRGGRHGKSLKFPRGKAGPKD